MPQYNRAELGRMATESGFVRDTFEKVEVEQDDDWFPVGDIQMICRIVDPYGTDEELHRCLEGEE